MCVPDCAHYCDSHSATCGESLAKHTFFAGGFPVRVSPDLLLFCILSGFSVDFTLNCSCETFTLAAKIMGPYNLFLFRRNALTEIAEVRRTVFSLWQHKTSQTVSKSDVFREVDWNSPSLGTNCTSANRSKIFVQRFKTSYKDRRAKATATNKREMAHQTDEPSK